MSHDILSRQDDLFSGAAHGALYQDPLDQDTSLVLPVYMDLTIDDGPNLSTSTLGKDILSHNPGEGDYSWGKDQGKDANTYSMTMKRLGDESPRKYHGRDGALPTPAMPFPVRPTEVWKAVHTAQGSSETAAPSIKKRATTRLTKRRPPPTPLPSFPGRESSDRSRWHGSHMEDRLSQDVIKNGFSDKAIMLNESNTARPSLWPHLNNSSGPQSLSTFFASVLNQRQDMGRVSAASTFKPPPRVTLTDTKREAWLRDLASEAIPLRRLSRTIPHGIRGKVLLEQCMIKDIPISRAVWLAKCVGANELRAFKRKGVSGALTSENEVKWVREWTGLVESAIQSAIDPDGCPDWKVKLNYIIQLSSSLFAEGLIEHSHFIDWVLSRFGESSIEQLPVNLLITQIYRKQIMASLHTGRELARHCLTKLHEIGISADNDILKPVEIRLQQLLRTIILSHPDCLIIPNVWNDVREVVVRLHDQSPPSLRNIINSITKRNDRLVGSLDRGSVTGSDPMHILVNHLDAFKASSSLDLLVADCLRLSLPGPDLVDTTIRWACSIYRQGGHRVYVAAHIIQALSRISALTNGYLLDCLSQYQTHESVSSKQVLRLFTVLIRSGVFDTARYLRWIIATGVLYSIDHASPNDSLHISLLRTIPIHVLDKSSRNMRASILRASSDTSIDEQENQGQADKSQLSRLEALFKAANVPSDVDLSRVGLADLIEFRNLLEDKADHISLARLLRLFTPYADADMLSILIDTAEANLMSYSALKESSHLFEVLIQQYRKLRIKNLPCRDLVEGLSRLATKLAAEDAVVTFLQRELQLCEPNPGIAAYTPISDCTIDMIGDSTLGLEEEIEKLLSAGAKPDEQTFTSLFKLLVTDLCSTTRVSTDGHQHVSACPLLLKLKIVDAATFDRTMSSWLVSSLMELCNKSSIQALISLIASGCVSLETLMSVVEGKMQDSVGEADLSQKIAAWSLSCFTRCERCSICRSSKAGYRLDTLQRDFCLQNSYKIVRLAYFTGGFATLQNPGDGDSSPPPLSESRLAYLCIEKCITEDPMAFLTHLEKWSQEFVPKIFDITSHLVISFGKCYNRSSAEGNSDNMQALPAPATLLRIAFDTVDELSLPFFQVLLGCMVARHKETANGLQDLEALVLDATKTAVSDQSSIWPKLFIGQNSNIGRQILSYSEDIILANTSCERNTSDMFEPDFAAQLRIVEALGGNIFKDLKVNCVRIAHNLAAMDRCIVKDEPSQPAGFYERRLSTILSLLVLYLRASPANHSALAQPLMVQNLCNLLLTGRHRLTRPTTDHIFDTVALIILDLSPSSRSSLAATMPRPVLHDPRLRFLLGIPDNPDAWLHITRPMPPPPPTTTRPSSATDGPANATTAPFQLRRWELLPDAAPNIGENDTALSLRLFDARRVGA